MEKKSSILIGIYRGWKHFSMKKIKKLKRKKIKLFKITMKCRKSWAWNNLKGSSHICHSLNAKLGFSVPSCSRTTNSISSSTSTDSSMHFSQQQENSKWKLGRRWRFSSLLLESGICSDVGAHQNKIKSLLCTTKFKG